MRVGGFIVGLVLLSGLAGAQENVRELRKGRLGLSADRIVRMGLERWQKRYDTRVQPSGATRGVAVAVFVDALREQNGRLYAKLTPTRRGRLRQASSLLRKYETALAQNEWTITGGNAWNPESDTEELARAEGAMLAYATGRRSKTVSPAEITQAKTILATRQQRVRQETERKGKSTETFGGAMGRPRAQVTREMLGRVQSAKAISAEVQRALAGEPRSVGLAALKAMIEATRVPQG